jgi:hypothetical protein
MGRLLRVVTGLAWPRSLLRREPLILAIKIQRTLSTSGKPAPLREGRPMTRMEFHRNVTSRNSQMNKILGALIAGLFAVGAYAQAPAAPAAAPAAPAAAEAPAATPAAAPAKAAKMTHKAKKARKAHKAKKAAAAKTE